MARDDNGDNILRCNAASSLSVPSTLIALGGRGNSGGRLGFNQSLIYRDGSCWQYNNLRVKFLGAQGVNSILHSCQFN